MFFRKKLAGRRIAVLASDGFEQVELTVPVKALRAAGAIVDVISLRPGKIVGMQLNVPGRSVKVDKTLAQAGAHEYDALFVPGGYINPDTLRQSELARQFVRAFDAANKPVATLCHGPWLLASAGIAQGRELTSWPGVRDDLVNAGAVWRDEPVVRDCNWVTSRGPQDLAPFVREMVALFAEPSAAHARHAVPMIEAHAESAPQHREPPALVAPALGALPRLARVTRTLATAAAVVAGGVAIRRALA